MASEPILAVTGQVTDLFGHRFVLQTPDGKILADLGPRGAHEVHLELDGSLRKARPTNGPTQVDRP